MTRKFSRRNHDYAVILAGGDGTRLREVTRRITGDSRPKQFCRFFGDASLLSATRQRIAPIFHEDRTLFLLAQAHEPYYREELDRVHSSRMVVQPANRGTAVAMVLCLQKILREDEQAAVAFFPSDHHYEDCSAFRDTIRLALDLASDYPQSILIIGAEPRYAEVEYGWIEPSLPVRDSLVNPLYRVARFWEKPQRHQAETLQAKGALWNTFVIVGLVGAFMELLRSEVPGLVRALEKLRTDDRLYQFYEQTEAIDFSRAVLQPAAPKLVVLKDVNSGWTDLGNPQRIAMVTDGLNRRLIQTR